MKKLLLLVEIFLLLERLNGGTLNTKSFPEKFLFGVTSSAYQIEGSWNVDGKDPSIWDTFTHNYPDRISDKSNADVSCDSYKRYKQDVDALRSLNVGIYKFSLSISRILPNGKMNHLALDYYNQLIDLLVANDIEPMVTLFHWDTSEMLQELGGWTNPFTEGIFVDYARLAFETFGDRVKYWITFNDPFTFCMRSNADGNFPPADMKTDSSTYLCSYVIIKAHASVYKLYNTTFKPHQKGLMSISLETPWFEPGSSKKEDIKATENLLTYTIGQFADPIFVNGHYPSIMQNEIYDRSLAEGFLRPRLPRITNEEASLIKKSADFFALNFNTEVKVFAKKYGKDHASSFNRDVGIEPIFETKWNTSSASWIQTAPKAFRKILKKIKDTYANIPIYITECGFPDTGETEDYDRTNFHQLYLSSLLDSIYEDNVTVIGYNIRSLLDSFEWNEGYTIKYGLYQVDMNEEDRPRIPKLSSVAYKEIIHNRKLPSDITKKP